MSGKAKVPTFPFPPSNPAYTQLSDVVYVAGEKGDSPLYHRMHRRAVSDEARFLRHQYVSIEEELERAYRAVCPCEQNAGTFSFKFAEVIRSAAGAYEVFCKTLHARFHTFDEAREKLDVYNYLALDRFLDLSGKRVAHLLALDQFPGLPELTCPFVAVAAWDRASPVGEAHVPGWWRAYRDIKHDMDGLRTAATLANATASVAALFLLIESCFGFCILAGGMYGAPKTQKNKFRIVKASRWARLFDRT